MKLITSIIQLVRAATKKLPANAINKNLLFHSQTTTTLVTDVEPEESLLKKLEDKFLKPVNVYIVNRKDISFFKNNNANYNTFVDKLLTTAIDKKASDCFVEINDEIGSISYRCNGIITIGDKYSSGYCNQLLMCILVLSQLNFDKTDMPQEGRFKYFVRNKLVSCRISYVSSQYSKSLAIRLFYDELFSFNLSNIGMPDDLFNKLVSVSKHSQKGLILVTGATGSGKTTTLYSVIEELVKNNKKVITLEDPIEAEIDGAIQCEIDSNIGFTFDKGITACLRQDPDTIVIGEIRDKNTAEQAFYASLSGYMVIATLHVKSLDDVKFRCKELGIEENLFADNVICTIHQSLLNSNGKRVAKFEYL